MNKILVINGLFAGLGNIRNIRNIHIFKIAQGYISLWSGQSGREN